MGSVAASRTSVVLAALALGVLVAFWDLGTAPLDDWDEGHHAKVALDMIASGEWLVYAPDGEVERWNTKPPLMFYALIGAFRIFGPTEFAARLLPAASFVLLLMVTASFVHRVLSPGAAWMTLWLMATSRPFLFEHFARDGTVDAPLALCLSLAMYALWLRGKRAGLAFVVPFAIALLAKGMAALQILPAIIVWAAWNRDRGPRLLPLVLAACLPVFVWVAARELAAPGFLADMVRNDLVGRATQVIGAPRAHAWLYVDQWVRAFWRIAAGVLILAAVGRRSWTLDAAIQKPAERGRLLAFLASWWLVPLVLFSLMQTKHEWYTLPSYVPAYILAGWLLAAGLVALHTRVPVRYRTAVVGGVGVALLAFVSGKTLSTLLKHQPVAARNQRIALEHWLDVTSRTCRPPCEIGLFRAYEQPAARFYLTRAGVAYRGFDAWSLPVTSRPLLAKDGSAAELRRVLPSVRPVAEFPALSLTLVELP